MLINNHTPLQEVLRPHSRSGIPLRIALGKLSSALEAEVNTVGEFCRHCEVEFSGNKPRRIYCHGEPLAGSGPLGVAAMLKVLERSDYRVV